MKKKIIFWTLTIILLYFCLEIFCLTALVVLKHTKNIAYNPLKVSETWKLEYARQEEQLRKDYQKSQTLVIHSPVLGWAMNPNASVEGCRINSQGIRSDRDYDWRVPAGAIRIAAFGDSFTFGDGVANPQTWEEELAERDKRLEVLNFGVGGYGLDQAYLRYLEEGVLFHPQIVFIGFLSENINRHVNVFRPFYQPDTGIPWTKPRFYLAKDQLLLRRNPISTPEEIQNFIRDPLKVLSELGRHDYFSQKRYFKGNFDFLPSVRLFKVMAYELAGKAVPAEPVYQAGFYNPESEAFLITVKLFEKFYLSAIQNGSMPVILLFPQKKDLARKYLDGALPYDPLRLYFENKHYPFLDLSEPFIEAAERMRQDAANFFGEDGYHYNALGHEIAAEAIHRYLKDSGLL